MDSSALIFVALAVAWAAYLLPLALKHHDEDARSRTVDRFSHRLRVLARREPVDQRTARLVRPGAAAADPSGAVKIVSKVEIKIARRSAKAERKAARTPTPAPAAPQPQASRAAAKRATMRRRNVLAVLLVVTLTVIGLAAFAVVAWPYVAIPVGLLAAWLVACRVMVKGERRALAPAHRPSADRLSAELPSEEGVEAPEREVAEPAVEELSAGIDSMGDTSTGIAAIVDPAMWDPVPVTLPTYVTKPTATRRTVRTIDLDSTGVWTSGRTDADAQLAREADEADKEARKRRDGDRAVGS